MTYRKACQQCGRRTFATGRPLEVCLCTCGRWLCLHCFQRCGVCLSPPATACFPVDTDSDPPDTASDPAQTGGTR